MKILWVCRAIPFPIISGDRVYSAYLARAVAAAGASVFFFGGMEEAVTLAEAQAFDSSVSWTPVIGPERPTYEALMSRYPLVTARSCTSKARKAFATTYERVVPDVVVIDNYASGWVIDLLGQLSTPAFIVYIAHNAEGELAGDIAKRYYGNTLKRIALKLNACKIRTLEKRLIRISRSVIALTENDANILSRLSPIGKVTVLPPGYAGTKIYRRKIDHSIPRRAVMIGSLHWIAKQMNVAEFLLAADDAFAAAGVEVLIIGGAPDAFAKRWRNLRACKFTGFVTDINYELSIARFGLIIESTGGGFKLKVLDYIFNRVPVAALTGSFAGIPREVADNFVQAVDVRSLVTQIVNIIDNFELLNEMHEGAFKAAGSVFDWTVNGRRFIESIRY